MLKKICMAFVCAVMVIGMIGCSAVSSADDLTVTAVPEGSENNEDDVLRVGVRNDISRFSYYNEKAGKYTGLEIDIAEEMARRMGYKKLEFETIVPENKEELLSDGHLDCIIACYSITPERELRYDFSPPYYEDYSIFMVQNSSLFTGLSDLKGCTLGVRVGTNTVDQLVDYLKEEGLSDGVVRAQTQDGSLLIYDTFRLKLVNSYPQLDTELEEGAVDAMCGDNAMVESFMTDRRSILNVHIAEQSYGVATAKGSPLSVPIAEAIQSMLDDGTIEEIINIWD